MLNEAQQQLVIKNIGFCRYIVNKWCKRQYKIDRGELDSIAYEAFCNAAKTYDKGRGSSFIHFAKLCVNQSILKVFQMRLRRSEKDDEIHNWATNGSHMDNRQEYTELHLAISELSVDQQEILTNYYFKDMELSEIAKKHGLAVSTISKILKAAREALKEKIA